MFGQLVRAHRRRLGLTQQELADKAGLGARSIRNMESGRIRSPRPATVRLLADAFGLTGPTRDRFCEAAGEPSTGQPVDAAVPAQLPSDVSSFTGREAQLAELDALFTEPDGLAATAVVISAVSGTAGVGKTALAVHWSHRVAHRFPDGQLYVNLRGYDPDQPMVAGDALARFLAALGVSGPDIPFDPDERAALFRTRLTGRRMLVVLDNAATVEQVRPLLPGSASCAVVVTSRDKLAGLIAVHGARRLDLDLLPPADAVTLLRRLIGARVDAEPRAAAELADLCSRLPLALRVAAERAVGRPGSPLAELVADLASQSRRLDLLDAGGDPRAAVRAVFSWSIRHLPPHAVRVFRLLGSHPGPDFDVHAAASLVGTGVNEARDGLELLARAHLIHDSDAGRYGMHDLLRVFATSLDGPDDDGPRPALTRLFDFYLAAAGTAMDRLYPAEAEDRPRVGETTFAIPVMAGPGSARAWLSAERACLVAMAAHAATHGWYGHAVRLSAVLYRYLGTGHIADALAVHGHARDAATRAGDLAGEARAILGLGGIYWLTGQLGVAREHLEEASTRYEQVGDIAGQARALSNLGAVETWLCRYTEATEHCEQALALIRRAGDPIGEAHALINLGNVAGRRGDQALAVDHHSRAVALFRAVGDRSGEASALNNLGSAEEQLGRTGAAIEHLEQSLALTRQLGQPGAEAWSLSALGIALTRAGRFDRAADCHERALALFHRLGMADGEAYALNGRGDAVRRAGRPADAVTHHTDALSRARSTEAPKYEADAHAGLGHAHRALGNLANAREHYGRALALYTELGTPDADSMRAALMTD
jgi:tetratricopeptide (TPR) repeat protein/transcriptional regulator with XRE-family HTH domain